MLWIGSTTPLTATDFRGAGDGLWWLAGPPSLLEIAETWVADAMRAPAIWVLSAALATALAFCRRRLRRKIGQIGERAARKDCSQFRPTLEAAAWTAAVAAAWPGLAWYLGWRLIAAADASDLCKACGAGLTAAAGLYAMLELFRQVCAAGGLGETHFGWPAGALKLLRQNLRWLSLSALPLLVVATAVRSAGREPWDSSLGRLCFIAVLLSFALFARRILRPGGGVFQAIVATRRGGWLDRLRYFWYLAGALTPAALAVLAAAGYYYTAQQLAARMVAGRHAGGGPGAAAGHAAALDFGQPAQAGHRTGPAATGRTERSRPGSRWRGRRHRAGRKRGPAPWRPNHARPVPAKGACPPFRPTATWPPSTRRPGGWSNMRWPSPWRWPSGARGSTCCRR